MSKYRIDKRDLDGTGERRVRAYDMPIVDERDYWGNVTGVACPVCGKGVVCWAEAGYVPGYRICDACGRHFLARGNAEAPVLLRVGRRRRRIRA